MLVASADATWLVQRFGVVKNQHGLKAHHAANSFEPVGVSEFAERNVHRDFIPVVAAKGVLMYITTSLCDLSFLNNKKN